MILKMLTLFLMTVFNNYNFLFHNYYFLFHNSDLLSCYYDFLIQ